MTRADFYLVAGLFYMAVVDSWAMFAVAVALFLRAMVYTWGGE